MRHLACRVRYSVVPINLSLLTLTFYSLVITTLVYNDTKYDRVRFYYKMEFTMSHAFPDSFLILVGTLKSFLVTRYIQYNYDKWIKVLWLYKKLEILDWKFATELKSFYFTYFLLYIFQFLREESVTTNTFLCFIKNYLATRFRLM
jgi:hypothetical protein